MRKPAINREKFSRRYWRFIRRRRNSLYTCKILPIKLAISGEILAEIYIRRGKILEEILEEILDEVPKILTVYR